MGDDDFAATQTAGGTASAHPPVPGSPFLVSPATADEQRNTLKAAVFPFACWKVENIRFDFDSSFVMPDLRDEVNELRKLIHAHTQPDENGHLAFPPLLSVFGHADPIGDDAYNKILAGRRAQVIYGLLNRNIKLWEELYSLPPGGGDRWGIRSIQLMLQALGFAVTKIDGIKGPETTDALKEFQSQQGLPVNGADNKNTRAELFAAYMDFLCNTTEFMLTEEKMQELQTEGTPALVVLKLAGIRDRQFPTEEAFTTRVQAALTPPEFNLHRDALVRKARTPVEFVVPKQDFLGGGLDKKGKADYQGCGEFNPDVILSQEEQRDLPPEEKIQANAVNRRVVVLLFRPGHLMDKEKWPCPRVSEGVAGCRKRFWSNGEDRRSRRLPEDRRIYAETQDTFACRFYDRMANTSPCEGAVKTLVLRLLKPGPGAITTRVAIANEPITIIFGQATDVPALATATDENGFLKIPLPAAGIAIFLELNAQIFMNLPAAPNSNQPGQPGPPTKIRLSLSTVGFAVLDESDDIGIKQRLRNLGYESKLVPQWTESDIDRALRRFQSDHGLSVTGSPTLETRDKLRAMYGS